MNELNKNIQIEHLDEEWIQLIKEAKRLGLSFSEIYHFLQNGSTTK